MINLIYDEQAIASSYGTSEYQSFSNRSSSETLQADVTGLGDSAHPVPQGTSRDQSRRFDASNLAHLKAEHGHHNLATAELGRHGMHQIFWMFESP